MFFITCEIISQCSDYSVGTLKSLAFVFNAETLAFRQKKKSKIEELIILIHRKGMK